MSAISDLSSTIRWEMSILVAISFLRSTRRSAIVSLVASEWSTSVSIAVDTWVAGRGAILCVETDSMAILNCATTSVMMFRRERISAFNDTSSKAYSRGGARAPGGDAAGVGLELLGTALIAVEAAELSES